MQNNENIIYLPGSKSHTNRALICAALADGQTELVGYGECEDTFYMIKALQALGVEIKNEKLKIKNCNLKLKIDGGLEKMGLSNNKINVGNAGTTMRFLVSLIGLVAARSDDQRSVILTGSARMRERPVGDLVEALASLGIYWEYVGKRGFSPLKIPNSKFQNSNKLQNPKSKKIGGQISLRGDSSSQYLSSILLTAPYFDQDTEIEISGKLTSRPYVDMTIKVMRDFGVTVINQNYKKFIVRAGQKYQPRKNYQIEPDASAASYFIAGAALTGQTIIFPGLALSSNQGDINFLKIIKKMQPDAEYKDTDRGLMFAGGTKLRGLEVDLNQMPDMVPTLAVLAMFTTGRTVIKNVKNLRIKESDRIRALATEIRKFGVKVKEREDGLEIKNEKLKIKNYNSKLKIKVYNDHRMAMGFAVAKLMLPDIIIDNPDCVGKSFPGFWKTWKKI